MSSQRISIGFWYARSADKAKECNQSCSSCFSLAKCEPSHVHERTTRVSYNFLCSLKRLQVPIIGVYPRGWINNGISKDDSIADVSFNAEWSAASPIVTKNYSYSVPLSLIIKSRPANTISNLIYMLILGQIHLA